jgi:hypothetical protein
VKLEKHFETEALRIAQKPDAMRTGEEENVLYWWFFHEMETATEEQLRYYVTFNLRQLLDISNRFRSRAFNSMFNKWQVRWAKFLLQQFPTKDNCVFVQRSLWSGSSCGYRSKAVFKGVLHARPLTEAHIELALSCGVRSVQDRARRIQTRLYDI